MEARAGTFVVCPHSCVTLMSPIPPPPRPQTPPCRGRLGYFEVWGTVPMGLGASVALTVAEQARLACHALLVSATKGCEGSRMTMAIP